MLLCFNRASTEFTANPKLRWTWFRYPAIPIQKPTSLAQTENVLHVE